MDQEERLERFRTARLRLRSADNNPSNGIRVLACRGKKRRGLSFIRRDYCRVINSQTKMFVFYEDREKEILAARY